MKKYVFTYLILFLVTSCSRTNSKQELIGNWFYSEGHKIDYQFRFYEDSLVMVNGSGWKRKLMWKVDADSIYTLYTDKPGPAYKYKLDVETQTLRLGLIQNDSSKALKFVKAKNPTEFIFDKIVGLNIDLPIYKHPLTESERFHMHSPPYLNFNIYAGYKNGNLVVKTDSSSNLENLNKEVAEFKEDSRDELINALTFNIVADKNVSKNELDSIKNILKKASLNNIVMTFKSRYTFDIDTVWIQVNE